MDLQGWYSDPNPTEFAVVGGDFVVGEDYSESELIDMGVDVGKIPVADALGTAISDSDLSVPLDGTSFTNPLAISPNPGATDLDNTIPLSDSEIEENSKFDEPENTMRSAAAVRSKYSVVSSWLDNARRTVYLRYGESNPLGGGSFGYTKISGYHNLNINVVKLVTQHPNRKTFVAGQKYNFEARIYRQVCSGWYVFRKCKTVESLNAVVGVDYRTSPTQFVGTFGVTTAFCQGYIPRCPDWAKSAEAY